MAGMFSLLVSGAVGAVSYIDYSVSCREGLGTVFCSVVDVIVVFDRSFK